MKNRITLQCEVCMTSNKRRSKREVISKLIAYRHNKDPEVRNFFLRMLFDCMINKETFHFSGER